jgi:predicted AAA+ superfamily ATPase
MSYNNPFTGSKLIVKELKREDEIDLDLILTEKEDENERFILFTDGLLVRKTKSEKKYFPKNI